MSMKEALRRRRGKGVDISIVLGAPNEVNSTLHGDRKPESEKDEDLGLAPEVENESDDLKDKASMGVPVMNGDAVDHPDEAQDLALLAKALGKNSLLARHMKK